jgi:hypothetical protein
MPAHRCPNEDEAIRQVNDWLRFGVSIEVAYFDQHVSYVKSKKFRHFLQITAMFSKGHDPRFISDLETAHRLLNNWVRTAADPLAWPPTLPGFEEFYNSAASSRTGVSPGGMALGHSAASSKAIAHRHKTLVLSISDRKEPDPPRVEAGNLGRWRRNPKNGTQAAFVVVPVLDVVGSSSLIREPAGLPVWVPNRNVFPTTVPVPIEPAPIVDPAPAPAPAIDPVPARQVILPDPPAPVPDRRPPGCRAASRLDACRVTYRL